MKKKLLDYRVIIEPEVYEDGSTVYVAHVPSLGISDYGDTVDDVLSSLKDGILLAVEGLADEGKVVPVDQVNFQIITSTQISTSN